jgi:Fe-S-cluster-containing dehydrogenase component
MQKKKIFTADMRLCTVCQICELACSFEKTGILSTASSRIHIPTAFSTSLGGTKPAICRHCEKPPCMAVCKVGAIKKDPQTGLVAVDEELCIGCMDCIAACPFGAASWDPVNEAIAMCDQCGVCVEWCPPKAINFVDRPGIVREKTAREVAKPDIEREGEKWPAMEEEGLKYESEELVRWRAWVGQYFASEGITGYEEEPSALPPSRVVAAETKRPRGKRRGNG